MADTIELVREFHKVFNHPIADKPIIISHSRMQFRIDFLMEELQELQEAWDDGNIREVADALGDIQYVLDGLFLECGLGDYKQAIVEEIHRSNLSKLCKTEQEAIETIKKIKEKNTTMAVLLSYYYRKVGDNYIVYREDGKTMKSENYFKPNLQKILNNDSK